MVLQSGRMTLYRCRAALEAVEDQFSRRLDHRQQCPKFSDVWPIENVWGIIKDRVDKKKCENLASLKREITKAWREMNADKNLLARLIGAIPKRCRAVISVNGDQIR